ncbi:hypothetical protein [Alkaliphilus hydrothermalis]|uniref:Uncharacterized protein n=1 Tax=Alkaliphilus hydrothermalis TaxID=1482730 RepID=A0ABS2NLD7_9FIRM|nr:hypothetical protein [Alkaliphilus hydrothermalis]MBM7613741.1 hypothetical protein [Alkaliphilus hydrothermalis]
MSSATILNVLERCIFCSSTNIRDGVPFNSMVTLKTDHFASHQTYADICMDCGSILRNYIETGKTRSSFIKL